MFTNIMCEIVHKCALSRHYCTYYGHLCPVRNIEAFLMPSSQRECVLYIVSIFLFSFSPKNHFGLPRLADDTSARTTGGRWLYNGEGEGKRTDFFICFHKLAHIMCTLFSSLHVPADSAERSQNLAGHGGLSSTLRLHRRSMHGSAENAIRKENVSVQYWSRK